MADTNHIDHAYYFDLRSLLDLKMSNLNSIHEP
jgi:hypothetical protein